MSVFNSYRCRARRVLAIFVAAVVASVVGGCPGEVPPPANEVPVARLLFPQLWPLQEPALFDASSSFDFDGDLVRVSLNFGDGTPEVSLLDGVFEHVYPNPGAFEVRLEIEDDSGAISEANGSIVIADRIDDPACSCDQPCFDDGQCDVQSRRCFVGAQSADEALVGPPPAVEQVLDCGP